MRSKTYATINPSKKLALLNGVIDVKTREFSEAKSTDFIIHQNPLTYDKAATCPTILKTLNDWLPEDQVEQALELIGYCLLQELPIHKSAVLLGDGVNGKTTFLNLLCAFLGPQNVSHVTLQQICEGKFELAQLYRKLANICDDLPGDAKNLSGDAPIQAQFKHKDPFDFWNTAKMIWACNKLPAASEDTKAYYRRFLILNFNRVFEGEKKDTHLLEKLTTPQELAGLLNIVLEKLNRLLGQQDFSFSKSTEELRQQYIRSADSCQSFIEEMVEVDTTSENAFVKEDDFYSRYISYCVLHNIQKKRKGDLTISMQKNRPEAQRTMIRILKKPTRVWQYIKIRENVTGVTTVTGGSPLSEFQIQNNKKREEAVTPVTPVTPEKAALSETEVFHFQRVNARVESHRCDNPNCPNDRAVLAEYKQVLSKDDAKELGKSTLYFCCDCFESGKAKAESNGVNCVLDQMQEQSTEEDF